MPFWSWSLDVTPFYGLDRFELEAVRLLSRFDLHADDTKQLTALPTATVNRFDTLADRTGGVVLSLLVLSGGPIVTPQLAIIPAAAVGGPELRIGARNSIHRDKLRRICCQARA